MSKVEVEPGIEIAYSDVGPRGARAVVLLHAWSLAGAAWDRQIQDWSAEFRVIAIDLRGHGASSKATTGLGPDTVADDVVAVLDHLEIDAAAIVGWSLGGAVAVRVSTRSPQRVSQLVLVGPFGPKYVASEDNPAGVPAEEIASVLAFEAVAGEDFRFGTIAGMPKAPYSDGLRGLLVSLAMQAPSWSAGRLLREFIDHDFRPDLAAVRVPTLVCQGRADSIAPPERVLQFVSGIKGARVEWFEESGHSPNLEETPKFNAIVRGYLGDEVN
ncbi:alpha/beta fold hydrolase [Nocardia rhamnosiphila]|uniref:Alpha/beta hydrolase n=1 Tax=Nocardia rhamnosiphila TaxID=426716 RepID=A0ABV2WRB2_9NOCA